MRPEARYTPAQAHVFRAVVGAVKNACDGHTSRWRFDPTFARSVAKRATGTLSAQWREVLAAQAPSDQVGSGPVGLSTHVAASPLRSIDNPSQWGRRARGAFLGATVQHRAAPRRSPLKFLQNRIGCLAGEARRAGNAEREQALVEVLRLIGAERAAR